MVGLQTDARDEFAALKNIVAVRRIPRQPMEIGKGDVPCAVGPYHFHRGVQRRERHAHVGGMDGNAFFADPEDGVHAGKAADGCAAAARLALVAGGGRVVEIGTAGPLQQVAAGRRGVAQLRRGAGEDGARKQGKARLDPGIVGDGGIARERADAQAAIGKRLDLLQGKGIDIDDRVRVRHVVFHEVDKVGAAGQELRPGACGKRGHGIRDGFGAGIGKGFHSAASRQEARLESTSSMASAMLV